VKPRLLDLFCCEGGASCGYVEAGFEVIGVDIDPQPRYPYEFVQADALDVFVDRHGNWWTHDLDRGLYGLGRIDAIHASPPRQRFCDLAHRNGNADDWPDLIEPIRACLRASGLPFIIENVEGAPLLDPIMLCGTMFPGLRVLRHRLFETNWTVKVPDHPKHPLVFTHDKRKAHYGKLDQNTSFVQVTGGGNATIANKRAAMGIDWMSNHGLNESLPPAYTRFLGARLMEVLDERR